MVITYWIWIGSKLYFISLGFDMILNFVFHLPQLNTWNTVVSWLIHYGVFILMVIIYLDSGNQKSVEEYIHRLKIAFLFFFTCSLFLGIHFCVKYSGFSSYVKVQICRPRKIYTFFMDIKVNSGSRGPRGPSSSPPATPDPASENTKGTSRWKCVPRYCVKY